MNNPERRWSDHDIEQFMGTLLRVGVIVASTVVALGGVVFLIRHGAQPVSQLSQFAGEPKEFRDPAEVFRAALGGQARAMIQIGILLMIAIPVTRVAFSIWAFFLQRDWLYVAVTALVLALLCYSLLGAVGG